MEEQINRKKPILGTIVMICRTCNRKMKLYMKEYRTHKDYRTILVRTNSDGILDHFGWPVYYSGRSSVGTLVAKCMDVITAQEDCIDMTTAPLPIQRLYIECGINEYKYTLPYDGSNMLQDGVFLPLRYNLGFDNIMFYTVKHPPELYRKTRSLAIKEYKSDKNLKKGNLSDLYQLLLRERYDLLDEYLDGIQTRQKAIDSANIILLSNCPEKFKKRIFQKVWILSMKNAEGSPIYDYIIKILYA